MKRVLAVFFALVVLCLPSAPCWAVPAIGTPLKVTQPDGSVLQVQIRGDEHQNWTELLPGGQTLIKNPQTKFWEYAVPLPDGTLGASGIKAKPGGTNAPANVPKGVRPQQNQELQQRAPQLKPQAAVPGGIRASAVTGTRNVLIVLVNFSDRALVTTAAGWYSKIFDTSSGAKSMVNFYKDNSFGAVTVAPAAHRQAGNPAGIVTTTIANPHPNYGGNIDFSSDVTIANAALTGVAAQVDFNSFDTNGDGILDPTELAIYFIYAGYEAAGSEKTPSVWAHAWEGGSIMAGTKEVNYWALNGELNNGDVQHPVGVIVHELGHSLFGVIDLYDPSGYNQALGNFSAMAAGSWGADIGEDQGTTPVNLDAWSRYYLGWSKPGEPARGRLSFPAPLSSTTAPYILKRPALNEFEYFLLENRQPVGWDRGLRSYLGSDWLGGLLILHVDDSVPGNYFYDYMRQRVVPVQASIANCDMLAEGATCRGHATTLFYHGNNDSWTAETVPNSDFYDAVETAFSVTGISAPLSIMTAQYDPDPFPPRVTAFTLPVVWTSFSVPITALAATDNVGVTGYLVTESSTPPAPGNSGWSDTPPARAVVTGTGFRTLYAWAKDAAGNVSPGLAATVTVTGNDTAAPTVTAFSIPASSASWTLPVTTFSASDNIGVIGYLLTETPEKPAPSDNRWRGAAPSTYVFASSGSKTLYAWAEDAAGNVSSSRSAATTITGTLPAPWLTQDIGSVGLAGSVSYRADYPGTFTIKGSGGDIWGSADAFRFVYRQMIGDGVITARVLSVQNTNTWAKAGVMIRESLAANARHAMVDITPAAGAEFLRRTSTGGSTTASAKTGISAPYFVKLERRGSTFTASVSVDSVNWTQIGSSSIPMSGSLYVGLVDSSHNNSALCTTTFDYVDPPLADLTPPILTAFTVPSTSSSLTVPITALAAADALGVTGYLVNEDPVRPLPTQGGWSATPPASYTFASTGVKQLYAWAKDATGNVSDSRVAAVTVSTSTLPAPWLTQDIGSVGISGSASYANGVFTVKGSGADIWGSADAFRFVYRQMTGDGEIVARVTSLQNTNSYAKAGVMIRQSLTANSMHAMMDLKPTGGAEFSRRTTTGGTTSATTRTGITAPYWVKLVRRGSSFTGYVSADGATWSQVGSATINMSSSVYVGLLVNSHNNSALCTATIDAVK